MNDSPTSKNWRKTVRNASKSLDDFIEEFSSAFGLAYGLNLEEDNSNPEEGISQTLVVPSISQKRHELIMGDEDMQIARDDVLFYDKESKKMTIDTTRLKHQLRNWATENLPKLFAPEHKIAANTESISELEDVIMHTLDNYKEIGLIKSTVPLPASTAQLHQQLDALYLQTIKLFSSPQKTP